MRSLVVALVGMLVLNAPLQAREEPALKVDVMFVGAHPDDDSMATATLVGFAPKVAVVCATRGEGGGNAIGPERGPALGLVREAEQRSALSKLGITSVSYLDCQDFGFTLSAEAAEADWGREGNLLKLVRLIRAMQPEVLFTTHPAVGHGHHRFVARLTTEAFLLAADPGYAPDLAEQEGLPPWQPRKLYYSADEMTPSQREGAVDLEIWADPATLERERQALREYRSQGWATNLPLQPEREPFVAGIDLVGGSPRHWPPNGLRILPPTAPVVSGQPFMLTLQQYVWGQPPADAPRLDLPHGWSVQEVSASAAVRQYQVVPRGREGVHPVSACWGGARVTKSFAVEGEQKLQLVPPSPVDPFPEWARSHGVEHLISSQRPVYVVGQGGTVPVSARRGQVVSTQTFRGERLGRHEISAHGIPVELAVVPSVCLPFEASIAATDVWEGTVDGASDLSARFGMRAVEDSLELRVDVTDDVVVSNIASDDNRSHWRTDSIELAFDPQGPSVSGHTLTTVKIGIIPFDLGGEPMAARTADAQPGPLARTLPNALYRSTRTPQGYRVEMSAPLADLGLEKGRAFGFNLIVYDADRAEARPGENANEGRLAWSPWPLVQGDPKFWGHVHWTKQPVSTQP